MAAAPLALTFVPSLDRDAVEAARNIERYR